MTTMKMSLSEKKVVRTQQAAKQIVALQDREIWLVDPSTWSSPEVWSITSSSLVSNLSLLGCLPFPKLENYTQC